MNNSTSTSESITIDTLKNRLLASMGIIYIASGTIGTFFNLFLFTRPTIWSLSACIPYLLAASMATIPILYSALLSRTLIGFQITPFYFSPIICKLQVYISNTSVSLFLWFMVACCWDRCLSSSMDVSKRRMSNMRTTRRTIATITCVISMIYAEIFYCFEANLFWASAPCSPRSTACAIIDSSLILVVQLIAPFLSILFFGSKTMLNIRRCSRRCRPVIVSISRTGQNNTKLPANRSVLFMLFIQVTLLLFCSMPLFAFKLYTTLPLTIQKSNVRRSVENFLFNLILMIYYFDKTFAFYIYTITSRHFRLTLKQCIGAIRRPRTIVPR